MLKCAIGSSFNTFISGVATHQSLQNYATLFHFLRTNIIYLQTAGLNMDRLSPLNE